MRAILDSNVLIAATNLRDSRSAECEALVKKLAVDGYKIVAPVTQLWDFVAYNQNPEKSREHEQNMDLSFVIEHHNVTHNLFTSTHTEAMTGVKGPDRVYVSFAKSLGLPLIANDKQILKNASTLCVRAISVEESLASGS